MIIISEIFLGILILLLNNKSVYNVNFNNFSIYIAVVSKINYKKNIVRQTSKKSSTKNKKHY